MRSAALALLSALALAACASPSHHDDEPQVGTDDLIGGTAARDPKYDGVGALVEDGAARPFCTATLVTPTLIITAQHCREGGSEEAPEDHEPAKVTFRLGMDASAPVRKVALKRWISAPDFPKPDHELYASDVMLAELANPITGIAPIPVANIALSEAPLGGSYELVGFGVRTADGHGEAEGLREVGTFKLEATHGNAFETRFGSRAKFDEYFATIDPDAAADGVADRMWGFADLHDGYEVLARSEKAESCYSDSGGPLLRTTSGKLEVVGVVSSGFPGYASSCLHLGTVFAVFGPKTQTFLRTNLR